MSDDEMPELEDLTSDLEKIKQIKGIAHQIEEKETEIKVNVIESKDRKTNQNQKISNSNDKTTTTSTPLSQPQTNQSATSKITKDNNDDGDFGKGFGRGFFKKQKAPHAIQQKASQKSDVVEDLTHIKSAPGTTDKTNTVETFSKDLKESLPKNSLSGLANNVIEKKDEWLNQDLLMKIGQNPNLMKYFMDPRFTSIIQEMQRNPKECMEKYGSNPEFSTFIREFSQIMGTHFTNLGGQKNASLGGNFNTPEVQSIMSDPKVIPFLNKLQKEGKVDIEELNKDAYLAEKINYLIEKKILNIQTMN